MLLPGVGIMGILGKYIICKAITADLYFSAIIDNHRTGKAFG
jgi:hypothetical protein